VVQPLFKTNPAAKSLQKCTSVKNDANDFTDKGRKGSSDADFRTIWCKKLRTFRNLWCVRSDKGGRGVDPVQTFCGRGKERGSIFRYFVRTSFMDGPL